MCLCPCACFRSASLILFRADNGRKKTHSDEDRWECHFQNEQAIFKKSCFPRHWRGGPLNSCCNDTKHLSHVVTRMSHLRLFFSSLTRCDSSMDVQGDYDPCDASGFIRINAVRLASPQPVQNSLSIKLFQWLSYFLLFSTGWENTTACRVCPKQRIKEDDTNLLPYRDLSASISIISISILYLQKYSILGRFGKCLRGLCLSV